MLGCQGANLGICAQGKHPPHPFSTVDGQVSGPLSSSKPPPTQDRVPLTVSTIVLRNQTRSQYSCAERGAVRKAPHRISRKGARQSPRVRVLLSLSPPGPAYQPFISTWKMNRELGPETALATPSSQPTPPPLRLVLLGAPRPCRQKTNSVTAPLCLPLP